MVGLAGLDGGAGAQRLWTAAETSRKAIVLDALPQAVVPVVLTVVLRVHAVDLHHRSTAVGQHGDVLLAVQFLHAVDAGAADEEGKDVVHVLPHEFGVFLGAEGIVEDQLVGVYLDVQFQHAGVLGFGGGPQENPQGVEVSVAGTGHGRVHLVVVPPGEAVRPDGVNRLAGGKQYANVQAEVRFLAPENAGATARAVEGDVRDNRAGATERRGDVFGGYVSVDRDRLGQVTAAGVTVPGGAEAGAFHAVSVGIENYGEATTAGKSAEANRAGLFPPVAVSAVLTAKTGEFFGRAGGPVAVEENESVATIGVVKVIELQVELDTFGRARRADDVGEIFVAGVVPVGASGIEEAAGALGGTAFTNEVILGQ